MDLESFIAKVKSIQKLPGQKAHEELSARSLDKKIKQPKFKDGSHFAAVLILVYPIHKGLRFVLTQRQEYNGVHSGQISLPGGKIERGESSADAALRETFEEIGVDSVALTRAISPIYIPTSNFIVTPYIGTISSLPSFFKDVYEVKEIIQIEVSELISAQVIQSNLLTNEMSSENKFVPSFVLRDKVVWGATAMILNEFKHLLLL